MKFIAVILLSCCFSLAQTSSSVVLVQQQDTTHTVTKPVKTPHTVQPHQNQRQQQQQGQSQAQQANNNQAIQSNYHEVRQAPFAFAPEAMSTSPCRVAGSAGVSSPLGGVALGGSKQDKECDKREVARAFALIGQYQAALEILCSTDAAKAVKNCATLPMPILVKKEESDVTEQVSEEFNKAAKAAADETDKEVPTPLLFERPLVIAMGEPIVRPRLASSSPRRHMQQPTCPK